MAANLGRVIGDYRALVDVCRARADELALSRSEIDRLSGLPSGYAGKILGKSGLLPGQKHKRMWPRSLELMLGTLGLRILLIEDEGATARTLALRTPINGSQVRVGASHWRNAPELEDRRAPEPVDIADRRGQLQSPAPALKIVHSGQKRRVTKYG